jgi:DNA-binding winged helix-turn-helix (wHTH) protein/Tol biopolymer transport system component
LDPDERLLLRGDNPVPLAPKVFETLLTLVQNAGHLIDKDHLMKVVWPDTFVEEGNLTKNIFALRKLLGRADNGQEYIETVPKRGYRFAAPVRMTADTRTGSQLQTPYAPLTSRWLLAVTGVLSLLLVAGVTFWLIRAQLPSPLDLRQRQLTSDSSEYGIVDGAVSPDGKYLVYADHKRIYVKHLGTGDIQTVSQPAVLKGTEVASGNWGFGWFPDSTRFVVAGGKIGGRCSIWAFAVMGGVPRKLRDDACVCSVSPDGALIAFTRNQGNLGDREIWLMGPNGEQARRLYEADENSSFDGVRWSPDGRRLVYLKTHRATDKIEQILETRDLNGELPTTIYSPAPRASYWLSDGRMILSLAGPDPDALACNFWELRIDKRTGRPRGEPRRLTNWAGFCMDNMSATVDGKRLAFHRWSDEASVYIADLEAGGTRITTPRRVTLSDSRNYPAAWAVDSQSVVFASNRNGTWGIFRQALGSDTAVPIVTNLEEAEAARVSPDGAWVLYLAARRDRGSSKPVQLIRAPIVGGASQFVLTASTGATFRCAKLPASLCALAEQTPDRKQLVFTDFDCLRGRGRELTRLYIDPNSDYIWDLSPNGSSIAIVKRSDGQIRVISLNGRALYDLHPKGWSTAQSLDWAADGKALLISSRVQGELALSCGTRVEAPMKQRLAFLPPMAATWQYWAGARMAIFG